MSKKSSSSSGVWQSLFAPIAIIVALIVSYYLYYNIMGNPVNFEGGNPKGHPIQGNYLGIMLQRRYDRSDTYDNRTCTHYFRS